MKNSRKQWLSRVISLALSLVMVFGLTSCGGEGQTSNVEYQVDELMTKIIEGLDLGYKFSPMELIKVEDEEWEYYTGIKESVALVESEASFITPMMGQAFQIVILKAKDVKDVETIKKELKENNDLNRWICRSAEQLIVTNNGRHIVCVMGSKEETEKVVNAFDMLFTVKSGERLIK